MFAVVTLEYSKVNLVLPIKWINQLNFSSHANFGINCAERHVVFFSRNAAKNADFTLPISNVFEREKDACYFARLNKYFRKYKIFLFDIKKFPWSIYSN